jgi:hypothetical protein
MSQYDASRPTLRNPLGFFPYAVLTAAVTALLPVTHIPRTGTDWLELAWGLGMAVCFSNVWWAHDWARRACGLLAIAGAVILLIKITTDASINGSATLVVYFSLGIPLCGVLAWYSSRPKIKEAMRTVRDAIARARAVPG